MAGVQDRAVTLSKWRACHAERQPVHPTTLRNQVKKVSRLSLHVFHLAQPILAHMRPRKQTDTPTHKHLPKLIPMFFLTQCRHHSRVCLQPWVHPIVSFLSPGSSKKTAIHRKPQSYPAYPRNPQLQCCDRKCRTSSTEMAVFFEGRQTHNSEDNIELGDGGAWPLRCGTSWDGCFFWRTRWGFFWFQVHFNCCWYACGCRSAHIHTHRCDNISVWNLRIVKACASVICDSPIKVDAKG